MVLIVRKCLMFSNPIESRCENEEKTREGRDLNPRALTGTGLAVQHRNHLITSANNI